MLILSFIFISIAGFCAGGVHFEYEGKHGPSHWGEIFKQCGGKHQSPININMHKAALKRFRPIDAKGFYSKVGTEMKNNGHTVLVTMNHSTAPTIQGGPMYGKGVFQFEQLHFHWGETDDVGSEAKINNVSYPAEMHMVFHNTKYKSFDASLQHNDGITVLGFFYELSEKDNTDYTTFFSLLDQITEPEKSVSFAEPLTLMDFISHYAYNYFYYMGSLTTPPCTEDVTWINFIDKIKISAQQLSQFRKLSTPEGDAMKHNNRPIQQLNKRYVYKSVPMTTPSDPPKHDDEHKCTEICIFEKQ